MKKLWYIAIFYSHIELYKRLYGIHMKNTKRESVFWHKSRFPITLLSPVGNHGCNNPRERDFQECIKMTLLSWMSLLLLEGRQYVPRNPTGAKWKLLCHSRWEYCHLLFISQVPVALLHLWDSNPWSCILGGGDKQQILCVEIPWVRCNILVGTKSLYSHV